MAINPPSDIVLGSTLAADPTKYQAAADRLRRAAGAVASDGAAPAASWSEPTNRRASTPPVSTPAAVQRQPASQAQSAKPPDAFAQLEAFVMQSFIQTMLPKNSQTFFGKGTAGEVWKSLMAEKLGAQIASSNQLGLAKRLAAGRSNVSASPLPEPVLSAAVPVSSSLSSILPFIKGPAAIDDTPTGEVAPAGERS